SRYARPASSFANPHFVDVVIQSYRHRYAYAEGDPAYEPIEQRLTGQPAIKVPTIVLHGCDDGVTPLPPPTQSTDHFPALVASRDIPNAGHNLPQEAPHAVVDAVQDLLSST